MNQTVAQVTNQYIVEAGAEYVLVSAHLGARLAQKGQPALASHADWQGKVYRIRGSEPGCPNLLEYTGYDIDPGTGQGTVKNPLGLHGYNCRHSHKPWDKRLRNPYVDENGNLKIDSGENRKRYGLQQKQRAMERNLRAWKRKLIEKQEQINNPRKDMDVDKLQQEYDRMAYQLTQKNKAYNDFCKVNDLQPQYDHIKVADFGREQTNRSNARAKRYKNGLSLDGNGGIIKTKNGIEVSTVSEHTIERAKERNVSRTDISNALENPLEIRDVVIDDKGRKSQRFIGENATVNINPDTGNVVTVWKNGSGTKKKYRKSED